MRLLILPLFILFFGCSTRFEATLPPTPTVKERLYTFYHENRGIYFTTNEGIMCSAMSHYLYQKLFYIYLPTNIAQLQHSGRQVHNTQLQAGDLLFFTQNGKKHVGIYVEQGLFLHPSLYHGLILESIKDPTYAKHLIEVRRIFKSQTSR